MLFELCAAVPVYLQHAGEPFHPGKERDGGLCQVDKIPSEERIAVWILTNERETAAPLSARSWAEFQTCRLRSIFRFRRQSLTSDVM